MGDPVYHGSDAMRCERHGIARSPDGECLLCVREQRAAEARLPSWMAPAAAASLALLLAAGLIKVGTQKIGAVRARQESAYTHGTTDDSLTPTRESLPLLPPEPDTTAWRTEVAEQLPAARRHVSITIYSAVWCGPCRLAKAWLDERQIPYITADIDVTPGARQKLRQLNSSGTIPTINIEGEIVTGFSAQLLDAAIDRAARRNILLRHVAGGG